jgi:hypothetical protein
MTIKKLIYKKRGIFFTLDALMALTILLITVMIFYPGTRYSESSNLIQKDVLTVLSNLKMGEYNSACNGCVNDYITNPNKSVLEQIGEFYVINESLAINLSKKVIDNLAIEDKAIGIGLYFGDELLASKNSTRVGSDKDASDVIIEKGYISGIGGIPSGGNLTGYTAKAYLTNTLKTEYFYFGGYTGDGDIYVYVDYNGTLVSTELVTANGLYENISVDTLPYCTEGQCNCGCKFSGGSPSTTADFTPCSCDLDNCKDIKNNSHNWSSKCINSSGRNIIVLSTYFNLTGNSTKRNLYTVGGYIKIDYIPNQSDTVYSQSIRTGRKYFPGIQGAINLYDSLYVPGNLTEMNLSLKFKSEHKNSLIIGNKTLYTGNSSNLIFFNNINLSSQLDYNELSNKTVPIRLWSEFNVIVGNADVFNVIDKSESMGCDWKSDFVCCGLTCQKCENKTACEKCHHNWTGKIDEAKNASELFVDIMLNVNGNKVGIIGFGPNEYEYDIHNLSTNESSLNIKIENLTLDYGTDICGSVNEAVNRIRAQSNNSRNRTIILMSDGEATKCCQYHFPTCTYAYAKVDAIKAAKDAWDNYNISVYTIGFGADSDNNTLKNMSNVSHGKYYFASLNNLSNVYKQIAEEIINISFAEQRSSYRRDITGSFDNLSVGDFYIDYKYITPSDIPYGLIITTEEQFDNELGGRFYIPSDSQVLDVNVLSYSGPRWTNNVSINGVSVYNLDKYNTEYMDLGDPFVINIPVDKVIGGQNTINLTTGTHSNDKENGSRFNKIVYTIRKNISAYSNVYAYANGCNWTIEFSDYSNISLKIPNNYSGLDKCYYNSDNHTFQRSLPHGDGDTDAFRWATFNLLSQLDFNPPSSAGTIDAKFTEDSLQIESDIISGIPYFWSTEVQVRKWY